MKNTNLSAHTEPPEHFRSHISTHTLTYIYTREHISKYDLGAHLKSLNRIKAIASASDGNVYVSLIVWKRTHKTVLGNSVRKKERETETAIESMACVSYSNEILYKPYGCVFDAMSSTMTG